MFTLEMNVEGVEKLIQSFTLYSQSLDDKLGQLCDKLSELGVETARAWYETGVVMGGQHETPEVEVVPTNEGCMIRAYGDTVFFLEFGAGIYAQTNEMNTEGLDTTPASWSKDHAQEFYKYGRWHHGDVEYVGIEPYSGMNQARASILQMIDIYAREIFTGEEGFR